MNDSDVPLPIYEPGPFDIVCGRGDQNVSRWGNLRFYEVIDEYKARYIAAGSRHAKTQIVMNIFHAVKPGRFIKRHDSIDGAYVVLEDKEARQKISHAMRYRLKTKPADPHESSASRAPLPAVSDSALAAQRQFTQNQPGAESSNPASSSSVTEDRRSSSIEDPAENYTSTRGSEESSEEEKFSAQRTNTKVEQQPIGGSHEEGMPSEQTPPDDSPKSSSSHTVTDEADEQNDGFLVEQDLESNLHEGDSGE